MDAAGSALTPLCVTDDATFWAWRTWTDFARLSATDKAAMTIVVPLAGFADWGLGHPLDAEETVAMALLQGAIRQQPANFRPLVIPPLRFLLGPDSGSVFAVDPPAAHALLREVAQWIHASGFRRLLLFNTSPWNEELAAAASRDLRIEFGLQIFRINLAALDLDFHPTRSRSRRRLQTLLTALLGEIPEAIEAPATQPSWGEEPVSPLIDPPLALTEATVEGAAILAGAVERLAGLFAEIAIQPPLTREGKLVTMNPG